MDAIMQVLDLDRSSLAILAFAVATGGVLGGAVAHWKRGKDMIVTGAIIGAIVFPIFAALMAMYLGMGLFLAAAVAILGMFSGILG